MNYMEFTDEELVERIRRQDPAAMDYLLDKYRNMVKRETREIYIIGADSEDLMQEGMIGLFKAIRDYNEDKNCSFHTFASLCVKRQICTAVTTSNRKKHYPLNHYISFYSQDEETNSSVMDILAAAENSNPEANLLMQEQMGGLVNKMDTLLSKYERRVLELYLDGLSYGKIAEELDKTEKSVDNAIQRIRRKMTQD
ncbi:MAG: RNA polymerase sporulation sigma factor SigH [Lachnospiraceae bacterium]|nr:RNA polymerase sporulation sigma factor SigH [Lachnospiraceae bacterium]